MESISFDKEAFYKESHNLINLFDTLWVFTNHLNAVKKSDEYWFKYNKFYKYMDESQKDIYLTITFEATYRMKYLSDKERKKYEEWVNKLIPDDYFDT